MGVVKANAYGGSDIEIAKYLQDLGIDYLAVANAEEGALLRKNKISTPILVFSPQLEDLEKLFEYNLEPAIYNQTLLDKSLQLALNGSLENYPIHLKFNTGMNRLGFSIPNVDLLKKVFPNQFLLIKSIYSHLGHSQEQSPFNQTLKQANKFNMIVSTLIGHIKPKPLLHLLNTSGIFNFPHLQFNMVRTGIGLYGFANDPLWDNSLKPVMKLESKVIQIQKVHKGDYVGYSKGYKSEKDARVAIIPLGYADGISRHSGNGRTQVWINGSSASIIGNICMDLLMVDVSDIECKEQDKVEFFGFNQSAQEFAENSGTITYEQLSRLGPRIKRKFT